MNGLFHHSSIPAAQLVEETAAQLEKDFGLEGLDFSPDATVKDPYERLFGETHRLVVAASGKAGVVDRLLYRMDISEARAGKALSDPADPLAALSDQILRRALEKVIWRKLM